MRDDISCFRPHLINAVCAFEEGKRYVEPLPELTSEVEALAAHVNVNLKRMGSHHEAATPEVVDSEAFLAELTAACVEL